MFAPAPDPPSEDSGAELAASRAELRATLKQVRQRGKTNKLKQLRTRFAQRAYTEEELERIALKSTAELDPADTTPPDYVED